MAALQSPVRTTLSTPLLHQKQLMNHMIDDLAVTSPDMVWAEMPKSDTSYEEGFREITYRHFSNAINGVAWWLQSSLGPGQNFETLAYFGPWDVRYILLILGGVKAGYKMVFPSSLYSAPVLADLLTDLDCKTILTSSKHPQNLSTFIAAHPLKVVELPSVEKLLGGDHPHFPYDKTFLTARDDPIVVMHTSGSTGKPKPITWTNDWVASFIQQNHWNPPSGFENLDFLHHGTRLFNMLPVLHCGNLFSNLLTANSSATTVIFPLPHSGYNKETLAEVLKHNTVKIAILTPNIVQEISSDPTMLDLVTKSLDNIAYAGGPVSQIAGDKITQTTRFFNLYACTENGVLPTLRPSSTWDRHSWKRLVFHPKSGLDFRPLGDGIYEAFVVRNPKLEEEQPVFKAFPVITEWATKDVFTPDPDEPGSWLYSCRTDDLIRFQDGTKFNPLSYEAQLSGLPDVIAAMVVGTDRPRAALLIQMSAPQALSDSTRSETVEHLWPTISRLNSSCPAPAIISKSNIILTEPEKPLPRTSKGTLKRGAALALYADHLDHLYSGVMA